MSYVDLRIALRPKTSYRRPSWLPGADWTPFPQIRFRGCWAPPEKCSPTSGDLRSVVKQAARALTWRPSIHLIWEPLWKSE
jgi:hypothetical protein